MNQIQQAQHELLDAVTEAVDDFAERQANDDIGEEDYRPLSVDEALQYSGTIADNEGIFKAQEDLVRAVIQMKYEDQVKHHQQEWADGRERTRTEDSMRGEI